MTPITLHIDGMTCNGCANGVRQALAALPVRDIDISLADKCATLHYDETRTTPDALIEAIENAGFDARV